jgi:hypothetical protein
MMKFWEIVTFCIMCEHTQGEIERGRVGGELSIIKLKFLLFHYFYDLMMRANFINFLLDPFYLKHHIF